MVTLRYLTSILEVSLTCCEEATYCNNWDIRCTYENDTFKFWVYRFLEESFNLNKTYVICKMSTIIAYTLLYHMSIDIDSNPLQYSCLENPMDRGAWWSAVHGLHRVGCDWSDLAAAAAALISNVYCTSNINPHNHPNSFILIL